MAKLAREAALLKDQLAAARDAASSSAKVAKLAQIAGFGGALSGLARADLEDRAFAARRHALEIEQTLAETKLAIAVSSGASH